MRYAALALCLLSPLPRALSADLQYTGQLLQLQAGQPPVVVKEFSCSVYSNTGLEPVFLVRESGTQLPWIEHLGFIVADAGWLSSSGPAVAYRHLERSYLLPLGIPELFVPGNAVIDSKWLSDSGAEFQITGESSEGGRDCWIVETEIGVARRHRIVVHKADSIVQSSSQTHFMGQGDRFEIRLQLAAFDSASKIDVANFAKSLAALQKQLDRSPAERLEPLTSVQTEKAAGVRDALKTAAQDPALLAFMKEVDEEINAELKRSVKLEDMAQRFVGQPVPKFTLLTLSSQEIPSASFAGSTIVLHFWDYAQTTLEQPYGQVAYLEFLNNRWQGKNISVYGIAVNSRLADPETRTAALREINKLKQFMKLKYDIALDAGAALNALGNPTRIGASLPLWVVIAPDGRIVHYQTGLYDIDSQVGLKELNDAVENVVK